VLPNTSLFLGNAVHSVQPAFRKLPPPASAFQPHVYTSYPDEDASKPYLGESFEICDSTWPSMQVVSSSFWVCGHLCLSSSICPLPLGSGEISAGLHMLHPHIRELHSVMLCPVSDACSTLGAGIPAVCWQQGCCCCFPWLWKEWE